MDHLARPTVFDPLGSNTPTVSLIGGADSSRNNTPTVTFTPCQPEPKPQPLVEVSIQRLVPVGSGLKRRVRVPSTRLTARSTIIVPQDAPKQSKPLTKKERDKAFIERCHDRVRESFEPQPKRTQGTGFGGLKINKSKKAHKKKASCHGPKQSGRNGPQLKREETAALEIKNTIEKNSVFFDIGRAYVKLGDVAGVLRCVEAIRKFYQDAYSGYITRPVWALVQYAEKFAKRSCFEEALMCLEAIDLGLLKSYWGPIKKKLKGTLGNHALAHAKMGDLENTVRYGRWAFMWTQGDGAQGAALIDVPKDWAELETVAVDLKQTNKEAYETIFRCCALHYTYEGELEKLVDCYEKLAKALMFGGRNEVEKRTRSLDMFLHTCASVAMARGYMEIAEMLAFMANTEACQAAVCEDIILKYAQRDEIKKAIWFLLPEEIKGAIRGLEKNVGKAIRTLDSKETGKAIDLLMVRDEQKMVELLFNADKRKAVIRLLGREKTEEAIRGLSSAQVRGVTQLLVAPIINAQETVDRILKEAAVKLMDMGSERRIRWLGEKEGRKAVFKPVERNLDVIEYEPYNDRKSTVRWVKIRTLPDGRALKEAALYLAKRSGDTQQDWIQRFNGLEVRAEDSMKAYKASLSQMRENEAEDLKALDTEAYQKAMQALHEEMDVYREVFLEVFDEYSKHSVEVIEFREMIFEKYQELLEYPSEMKYFDVDKHIRKVKKYYKVQKRYEVDVVFRDKFFVAYKEFLMELVSMNPGRLLASQMDRYTSMMEETFDRVVRQWEKTEEE